MVQAWPGSTSVSSPSGFLFQIKKPRFLCARAAPPAVHLTDECTEMHKLKKALKRLVGAWYFRRHDRETGKALELNFWEGWVAGKGLGWSQDFKNRLDPNTEVAGWLREIMEVVYFDGINVLDVGSGPITRFGYKFNGKAISVTACDPNADDYNRILDANSISPPLRTVPASGENLSANLKGERYFWVTCENALDHSENPMQMLKEMIKVMQAGGLVTLRHEEDEGVREGYRGYHKWNISMVSPKQFRIWNPDVDWQFDENVLGHKIHVESDGDIIKIVIGKADLIDVLRAKAARSK